MTQISENKKYDYDVVIIGAGPAGLTAAIYTSRANLSTLFIEKGAPGGKMVTTYKIENYPGIKTIDGPDLSMNMFEHGKAFGAKYKYGNVIKIESFGDTSKAITLEKNNEVITTRNIIIASGMENRVPKDIENIEKFRNKGVSYCAICDGPLYKGLPSIVIGGGNSAVEEGTYLASIASEVNVIVRDANFIAEKRLIEELEAKPNVKIHFNSQILKLNGVDSLESAEAIINGTKQTIVAKSLFPFIGFIPMVEFAKDLNIIDPKSKFIPTDDLMETSIKGIYAIGDIRVKDIRQIATAVSDGAIAGKIIANRLN